MRVAAGRLEPFVVGDPEEDLDGDDGVLDEAAAEAARWDAALAAEPTPRLPRSLSWADPTSANRACSKRCSARSGRSSSDVPGTTRDAIDTRLAWGRSEIVLIDTAGIRRRGKVASGLSAERYSTMRALTALSRADVAVLVIDAVEGLTSQDAHVAGYAVEEGKGLVLAVNKWDLVEDKTDRTFDQYVEWIRNDAPFLEFAPVFRSAPRRISASGGCWSSRSISGPNAESGPDRELNRMLMAATDRRHRRSYAESARSSSTPRRPRSPRRHSCSSHPMRRPSISRTGDTSRTGCARHSGSTERRSGSSSGIGRRSSCRGGGSRKSVPIASRPGGSTVRPRRSR
jgi:small GTP-binding protein